MTQRELEDLSVQDCFDFLGRSSIGRLVYLDERGPIAIPVNYVLADQSVVIRVGGGAKRAAMDQTLLAFEVDHIDDDRRTGWSVILRGTGVVVPNTLVPETLHHMTGSPLPWAFGIHNVWLKITPDTVTGKRLGEPRDSIEVGTTLGAGSPAGRLNSARRA
ncbi:MAG: Pyridoxamine 5-phosphate oxidase [Pseudonocardiales bacterium]|nr:Pyridoxamine 5-phosphate oxidase [Pseudonocardiales bacterium]